MSSISTKAVLVFMAMFFVISCVRNDIFMAEARYKSGFEHIRKGEHAAAAAEFEKSIGYGNHKAEVYYNLGVAYSYIDGKEKESEEAYLEAVGAVLSGKDASDNAKTFYLPNSYYNMACLYALRGDKDTAFGYLDKAVESGFRSYHRIARDEELESLRNDPRFEDLKKKIGGQE